MRVPIDSVGRAEVLGLVRRAVGERPHLQEDPDAAPVLECLRAGRAEVRVYVRHGTRMRDPPPVSEWHPFDVYVACGDTGLPVLRVVVVSGPLLSSSSVLRISAFCGRSGPPRRREAPALRGSAPVLQ